ncbi:MAG: exonuclease subunit SbcD, partial [Comamonadaceae bacterium]
MRILHTSDWHLGQHFMGKSRQAEHRALIDWVLVQVDAQAVDAVLIAGDIFDTGAPPSYARELYAHLVGQLHSAGVALLLIGGNHDSVATLGESRSILHLLGTTVVADVGSPADHVVVLPKRGGARGGQGGAGCVVCAVPFIRPRDVLQSQAGQSAQEKQQSLQAAIQGYYQAVHAAGRVQQAALHRDTGCTVPL